MILLATKPGFKLPGTFQAIGSLFDYYFLDNSNGERTVGPGDFIRSIIGKEDGLEMAVPVNFNNKKDNLITGRVVDGNVSKGSKGKVYVCNDPVIGVVLPAQGLAPLDVGTYGYLKYDEDKIIVQGTGGTKKGHVQIMHLAGVDNEYAVCRYVNCSEEFDYLHFKTPTHRPPKTFLNNFSNIFDTGERGIR